MNELTDRLRLDAVAENHRAWFRRSSAAVGAPVAALPGGELCLGREAMIFPSGELDADALIAAIHTSGARTVGCWSLHDNPELSTRLLARGFTWGWRPHWMAIAVPDVPPPPGAVLPFVVEPAAPPYATTLPYAPLGPEPAEATRLGVRLREKIVGSVVVHPFKGVAGLYGMGVAPKVRRRGIGSALVLAALDAARAEGCRHVVLNATDDGEHCYHACGFRSLGWGQTWWWSNGPAPSSRQLQLAEAIGFGDLAALDALAPRASELTDPLPCGETPLTLALLTDQPAVGAHLLESCPALAARCYAPHAATLLHLAVEHDRPAFLEIALAGGVDPAIRDATFDATALGWAEHFGRTELAVRLRAT